MITCFTMLSGPLKALPKALGARNESGPDKEFREQYNLDNGAGINSRSGGSLAMEREAYEGVILKRYRG